MARSKKRDDGRYSVNLIVGKKDGKTIRKYFYSRISIADAKRQRDAWLETHNYGMDGLPTAKVDGSLTLDKWIEKWLASYKGQLEANTRDFYKYRTKSLADFTQDGIRYGDMPMQAFAPLHLTAYLNAQAGKSRSTIRSAKMILGQLFSTAKANGIIDRDLCADMIDTVQGQKVKGTYDGHKSLPREWINRINENYQKHPFGLTAMMLLWTGMRPAEAAAITWDDIDLKAATISVNKSLDIRHGSVVKDTKTEAGERTINIFAPLRRALLFAPHDGKLVLTSASGNPYTKDTLKKAYASFVGYLERIANGVPNPENWQGFRKDKWIEQHKGKWITFDFSMYDLRSTFCTTIYDAGVDIKTAQKLMGHKDATTTLRIYTKLSEERAADSTAQMEDFISANYAF